MPILGNPRRPPSRREMNRPALRALHPVRVPSPYMACPSDTASWLDCLHHDEPPALPPTARPDGWADAWTLQRLDADLGEIRTPVPGTSTGLFDKAESVRRMSNRYAQRHRTGIEFMASTGRHHVFESLTEQGVLKQIDMCRPDDVVSQPFWLHWHDGTSTRRHAPDFLVREGHGTTVVNVRPDGILKPQDAEQFAALSTVATRLGWRHVLVGDFVRPHSVNVEVLSSARRTPHDPLGLAPVMRRALAAGPREFGRTVAATVAPALARSVLLGMIWRGEAAIDLAVLLTDRSPVRLGTSR